MILWTAVPRLGRAFPTMNERVTGLLFGGAYNTFDKTDLEPINYMIGNLRNIQDKPVYELNLDIIRYKVNNPSADKDQIITYIQLIRDRRPDDEYGI